MEDDRIVSKKGAESKGILVEKTANGEWRHRRAELLAFSNGIQQKIGGVVFVPKSEGRKPRGEISEFSRQARQRLRNALLRTKLKACDNSCWYGVTLTLPWEVDRWGEAELEDFRRAWNHFGVTVKREFPSVGWIFRVELQQRGAPHVHAVAYTPFDGSQWLEGLGKCHCQADIAALFRQKLTRIWGNCLSFRDWTERAALGGFDKSGVKVEHCAGRGAMMRYLLDHTSKSKQAQLGYKGKQWGYLNRKTLEEEAPSILELPERARVLFSRALARLGRFRLKDGNHSRAPFGSHKTKAYHSGVRFVDQATQARLIEWALNEAGF